MAFQIKDFVSITSSMINLMRSVQKRVTDFNVGSTIRTMLESVATEIDELYQQMFIGLREAIPVSVYNSFDFEALKASPSSGLVTVTIASLATPVVVTAGTVFSPSSGGISYVALQNVTVPAFTTTIIVPVAATAAGVGGNIPASTTFALNPPPTGFVSATNASPFINGNDNESEEDRKARFRAYIQTLSRGTGAAIQYGLKTAFLADAQGNQIERVKYAAVVEPWILDNLQPISLVTCFIHNGVGSTSSTLVDRAKEIVYGYYDENNNPVPGYKAAGVKVDVSAATETTLAVTGTITPMTGIAVGDLITQATDEVRLYLQTLNIGEKALKAELIRIIKDIPGVYDVSISSPAGNTTAAANVKLMPGTITITGA